MLDYLIDLGKYISIDPNKYCNIESTKIRTISEKTYIYLLKVHKSILKVYNDLFDLNLNDSMLFAKEGYYRYELSFNSTYDSYRNFSLWLPYRIIFIMVLLFHL